MLEDDIYDIERQKEKAETLPPGDEKAIRIATYNAIRDMLLNAIAQKNDNRKYEAMERATAHLRIMFEKIDLIQDTQKAKQQFESLMKADYEDPYDGDDYGKIKL